MVSPGWEPAIDRFPRSPVTSTTRPESLLLPPAYPPTPLLSRGQLAGACISPQLRVCSRRVRLGRAGAVTRHQVGSRNPDTRFDRTCSSVRDYGPKVTVVQKRKRAAASEPIQPAEGQRQPLWVLRCRRTDRAQQEGTRAWRARTTPAVRRSHDRKPNDDGITSLAAASMPAVRVQSLKCCRMRTHACIWANGAE